MRIAFLLQVHNEPQLANIFIKQLLEYHDSYVFVHVDDKTKWIRKLLIADERVIICPESHDVRWGDRSQICNTLYLLNYAFHYASWFDVFSFHSGVDLAIKPVELFAHFLEENPRVNFVEVNKLPFDRWRYRGGFGRVQLNWPKAFVRRLPRYTITWFLRSLYAYLYELGAIPGKKLPGVEFYGGSAWFTLRRDAVEYIINYVEENDWYLDLFNGSFMGDEIFIQTILMNSPFKETVADNNLRYIDWHSGPEHPRVLRRSDFSGILDSNAFLHENSA